jgi:DNA-directed RNA polymerase subunit alpha
LSELVFPKIELVEGDDRFGRFVAGPLEKGFGITLGNALRRVLLSYLPGAAVNMVAMEGIQHEFSTIPHVKEDMMELLLNIKALRIKALANRGGKLNLEVTGERKVYASDIQPSVDFEITNPDLYLATLDSPEAKLEIEMDVELGRGYSPADSGDNIQVGAIPLDAIFTPVTKVDFSTEPIHIGRETSQERLHLEVRTDGTISPADALSQAADILIGQFNPFAGFGQLPVVEEKEEATALDIPQEKYNMPVEQLDLSVRTMNCLRHAGITTIGEVIEKGEKELMGLRNFGHKSLVELRERFATMGLSLADEEPEPEPEPEEKKKRKKKPAAGADEPE